MVDDRSPDIGRGAFTRPAAGAGRSDDEALAPVIPIFGGRRPRPDSATAAEDAAEPEWHTPWREAAPHDIPGRGASTSDAAPGDSSRGRAEHPSVRGGVSAGPWAGVADAAPGDDVDDGARERGEAVLLRKLRSRSLSLSESRAVLLGVEGMDEGATEAVIARFIDLGYLDDVVLAEQLALSAVERRAQGRRAVVQTLRSRGIPRDIAEAVVAEMPDEDDERALEFARSKVRGVEGRDYDTALRRLSGQLARRGYASSVSMSAARRALSEAGLGRRGGGASASGVRFTPDE